MVLKRFFGLSMDKRGEDMENFKEKVIWITGASSGIGRALTAVLYQSGASLIVSDKDVEPLGELCDQFSESPSRISVLPFDLSALSDIPGAFEQALAFKGRIDILINCAGVSQRSKVIDTDTGVILKMMDVNFSASVVLTKSVLPQMLERKNGMIVTISSLASIVHSPYRSAYSASKSALNGFYNSLRAEVKNLGVDVLLVIPGFVRTNISRNALKGDGSKHGELDNLQAAGLSPERAARGRGILGPVGAGRLLSGRCARRLPGRRRSRPGLIGRPAGASARPGRRRWVLLAAGGGDCQSESGDDRDSELHGAVIKPAAKGDVNVLRAAHRPRSSR